MRVTIQKGNIFDNAPKTIIDADYTIVTTDSGTVCFIIKTLDANNVLLLKHGDPSFDSAIVTLGLDKNTTLTKVVDI